MEIILTFPGVQGTDPRNVVQLREPGTPWPLRFYFLRVLDDETNEVELLNVGFEIGTRVEMEAGMRRAPLEKDVDQIDPVALQRIAQNYATYVHLARNALVVRHDGMAGALRLLRGKGLKPARLNDDFYRLVASDYAARRESGEPHPIKALAGAHHVTISTASRWVKEARRRGFVGIQ